MLVGIEGLRVGVVGLGYVGLPLALAFGHRFDTVGFDIGEERVAELKRGHDRTREADAAEIAAATRLTVTHRPEDMADCNFFVVTVPTPIDEHKRPLLTPLEQASRTIGRLLKPGSVVVYESTVYPGATEEVCVPILEAESGLKLNAGFFVGYSPERVNPGDREHRLPNIVKVVSGSTPEAGDLIEAAYRAIVPAGTHRAPSIRVAEAAKVIENTQRDVNIALINELAIIFDRLGIDTGDVLAAAGTKWNFLNFRPGLVGGHCIGVDPYYLTHKAQQLSYHPEIILAGRRINDGMGRYVVRRILRLMARRRIHIAGSRILVLGLAFKENCPDIRNTRVIDIVQEFEAFGAEVDVHDPWVDAGEAEAEYGVKLVDEPPKNAYDAVILAVAHKQFTSLGPAAIRAFGREQSVLFDVKQALPLGTADGRL